MKIHRDINSETKSLIHLNLMQGVGSKTVHLLIDIFGSAENALKAASEDIKKKFRKKGKEAPPGLIHKKVYNSLEEELKLISKHECNIITFFDEEYPPLLKKTRTHPPVLYVKGVLEPQDQHSICIVGTREASDYGMRVSHKLSYELAKNNITVVSGLAKGVDSSAHHGALDAGGRTIAVIGRGLSEIYPPENRKLAEEIQESGALISRFPMQNKNERKNMHERNRIMSGLAYHTVVVEAPNKSGAKESGALSTAEETRIHGRKVFAVPGEILSKNSAGCHQLIKDGAQLLDNVEDLLKEFPQYVAETTLSKQQIISEGSDSQQMPLPFVKEKHERDELPLEPVVENAVVEYFKNKFPGFSFILQYEIWKPDYYRVPDVVLVDEVENPIVIVECKKVGAIGTGKKQLKSYLSNTIARFGVFANSKEPDSWDFYEKVGQDGLNLITRPEFEKGVLDDINTK